jgi:hypothetical protein
LVRRGKKLDVPPTDYVDTLTCVNVNQNVCTQTSVESQLQAVATVEIEPELGTDAFSVWKKGCASPKIRRQ